ncbi:MAG TPA: NADPH-dependent F420 reductase [Actinomycetota bacterium]|nr:NADPH-dependent F420 reductase [Actinomycetota bacterium]
MNVAIIGTGNVGGALARTLSSAGHQIVVTSTTPEEAQALANEVGGRSVRSNVEAIEAADIVIMAVPFDAIGSIVAEVGATLEGKVVIDVTNRMSQDNPGSVVDGTSNAEQVQSMVPGAYVVKAFNTVLASRQADPKIADMPVDNFVAATDPAAKATVVDLVRSIGMRPIDAGPLEAARVLEGMGALNIFLNMQGGTWQNAWKLVEPSG